MSSSLRYQESRVTRVTRVWGRSARVLTCIAGNGETGKEARTQRSKQASNQAMQKIWSEPSSLVLGHGQHGRFLVCGEEAEEPGAPLYKLEVLSPDEEDKPIALSNTTPMDEGVKTEQTLPVPFAPRPATVVL